SQIVSPGATFWRPESAELRSQGASRVPALLAAPSGATKYSWAPATVGNRDGPAGSSAAWPEVVVVIRRDRARINLARLDTVGSRLEEGSEGWSVKARARAGFSGFPLLLLDHVHGEQSRFMGTEMVGPS